MRDFFKSTRFKVILCILALLFGFMVQAAYSGTLSSTASRVIGYITTPFQYASSKVTGWVGGFFDKLTAADELIDENQRLREEIAALQKDLADLDEFRAENEDYKDALDIMEENPTYELEIADVISRDASGRFSSFKINKGRSHGLSELDAVITKEGMVGVISELGDNYAIVMTILDPGISVSAIASESRDPGFITGQLDLAQDGLCRLRSLPMETEVKAGMRVVVSDISTQYPKGLMVGTVTEVRTEDGGKSKYAVVQPAVNPATVTTVFVVKGY